MRHVRDPNNVMTAVVEQHVTMKEIKWYMRESGASRVNDRIHLHLESCPSCSRAFRIVANAVDQLENSDKDNLP